MKLMIGNDNKTFKRSEEKVSQQKRNTTGSEGENSKKNS